MVLLLINQHLMDKAPWVFFLMLMSMSLGYNLVLSLLSWD